MNVHCKGSEAREVIALKRQLAIVMFLIFLLPISGGWAQELTIISEENPPFKFSQDGVFTGSAT
jgi:hypothetical protein